MRMTSSPKFKIKPLDKNNVFIEMEIIQWVVSLSWNLWKTYLLLVIQKKKQTLQEVLHDLKPIRKS